MNAQRETALKFGERGHLAGVLTQPQGEPRGCAALVTAGLTPKFGPFRLYAQLARRLAADGFLTLRFDLGGIGDSAQLPGALPLRERTTRELRAAVDLLRGRVAEGPLILGGLCSGAEDALRYAAVDPRVTGLVLMDPFGYRTPGWAWRDALISGARKGMQVAGLVPEDAPKSGALVDYKHMEETECRELLTALAARKVRMHYVYTGGMREVFNHRGQFRAMLRGVPLDGLVTLDYLPQLRHTQVLESDRRLVIESIARSLPCRV